jgi:hypothetical protein
VLLELIKEKDLDVVLKAIDELAKIKESIVNTDNIKNIVFKTPSENNSLTAKDASIQKASIDQISVLNKIFNLQSVGGYKN